MNARFVYFLKMQLPYLVGFLVFTITNHEKQGELMVRSLYQIGALARIKAYLICIYIYFIYRMNARYIYFLKIQ